MRGQYILLNLAHYYRLQTLKVATADAVVGVLGINIGGHLLGANLPKRRIGNVSVCPGQIFEVPAARLVPNLHWVAVITTN